MDIHTPKLLRNTNLCKTSLTLLVMKTHDLGFAYKCNVNQCYY